MSPGMPNERGTIPSPGLSEATLRAIEALRAGAVLFDRSARVRATFAGPRSAEVLTGLVTNDVLALAPGDGQYAAALTPKGKIIADLRLFARDDGILVDVPERAATGWWEMIRKYVNPRLSKYADVSGSMRDIGVFGPRAREIVAETVGVSGDVLEAMAPYAHRTVETSDGSVLVARVPDLGVEGYELFVAAEAVTPLWEALQRRGAVPGTGEAFEVARVEAGRPEWGIDMDDSTLAQEANLDELRAISYTKGCYTGQETVARVHFRGHVNRHLRGLRFSAPPVPPRSAALHDANGRVVGDVRSAVLSPHLGGLALAMVRREVEPGSTVQIVWELGATPATVVALPFVP
ncbi:MAG TPA: glycine cleavage T C-terminal barrel domain-containing protein [Gemmatimonadaceae bacterium]